MAFLSFGCGDSSDVPPARNGSEVRVLSKPPAKEAKLVLPDASVWETPLADPGLERGRVVWTGTCIQCHSIGLGGAPLIGNQALWAPRIEKGIEVLIAHAQEGFYGDEGEMPARGGNEALSDEDIEAAVRFMVSRAQP
ncbi:MAG: cytochrome c5 family protein [Myxococcota bacterium]